MISVRIHGGSVAELHALPMPTEGNGVELWHMRPHAPAIAMGSGQKPDLFLQDRLRADGLELGGRRSGGGAVFIDPSAVVWVDLLVPKSSELYSGDLVEMFERIGGLWQAALASCGVTSVLYEAGDDAPSSRRDEARLACWAGTGWGELLVDGYKIVGLSQRRTRWGARVQGMAVLNGSAARVVDYLAIEPDRAAKVRRAIGQAVSIDVGIDDVVAALAAKATARLGSPSV